MSRKRYYYQGKMESSDSSDEEKINDYKQCLEYLEKVPVLLNKRPVYNEGSGSDSEEDRNNLDSGSDSEEDRNSSYPRRSRYSSSNPRTTRVPQSNRYSPHTRYKPAPFIPDLVYVTNAPVPISHAANRDEADGNKTRVHPKRTNVKTARTNTLKIPEHNTDRALKSIEISEKPKKKQTDRKKKDIKFGGSLYHSWKGGVATHRPEYPNRPLDKGLKEISQKSNGDKTHLKETTFGGVITAITGGANLVNTASAWATRGGEKPERERINIGFDPLPEKKKEQTQPKKKESRFNTLIKAAPTPTQPQQYNIPHYPPATSTKIGRTPILSNPPIRIPRETWIYSSSSDSDSSPRPNPRPGPGPSIISTRETLEREALEHQERERHEREALERKAQEYRKRERREREVLERKAQERVIFEREALERKAQEGYQERESYFRIIAKKEPARERLEREALERKAQEYRKRERREREVLERKAQERVIFEREALERKAQEGYQERESYFRIIAKKEPARERLEREAQEKKIAKISGDRMGTILKAFRLDMLANSKMNYPENETYDKSKAKRNKVASMAMSHSATSVAMFSSKDDMTNLDIIQGPRSDSPFNIAREQWNTIHKIAVARQQDMSTIPTKKPNSPDNYKLKTFEEIFYSDLDDPMNRYEFLNALCLMDGGKNASQLTLFETLVRDFPRYLAPENSDNYVLLLQRHYGMLDDDITYEVPDAKPLDVSNEKKVAAAVGVQTGKRTAISRS
ncbi:MAG: hypothetical protein IPP74_11110 [Alphaproteobacteria bacterium]|nr:hypothetical protein [Alphaproteobacteria bacterium]